MARKAYFIPVFTVALVTWIAAVPPAHDDRVPLRVAQAARIVASPDDADKDATNRKTVTTVPQKPDRRSSPSAEPSTSAVPETAVRFSHDTPPAPKPIRASESTHRAARSVHYDDDRNIRRTQALTAKPIKVDLPKPPSQPAPKPTVKPQTTRQEAPQPPKPTAARSPLKRKAPELKPVSPATTSPPK